MTSVVPTSPRRGEPSALARASPAPTRALCSLSAMSSGLDRIAEQPSPAHLLDLPTAGGRVIRGSVLRVAAYFAGMLLGVVGAALMTRHLDRKSTRLTPVTVAS